MDLVKLRPRMALCGAALACPAAPAGELSPGANPVLRDRFTADPAPLVVGDTACLYVGESWPGHPALASVTPPLDQAPEPAGVNSDGGAGRLAQTFVPRADIASGRSSLYAGDGHGTDAARPLRLSLRDVEDGTGLLGAGQGLAIACRPQGPGMLSFDFSAHPPVVLQAGRRYMRERPAGRRCLTAALRSRDAAGCRRSTTNPPAP